MTKEESSMKDADYYAENTSEFDELTEAQKESVFDGGTIEIGDTSNADDIGEQSDDDMSAKDPKEPATEEISDTPPAELEDTKELEPELLAKDGKHTIPYSQLVEARQRAEQLEAFSNQQQKLIDELQAAKTQDEETGGTEAQDALIDEYEGDYPEIAEEMKPFIQKMIDDGVKAATDQFNAQVAPMQKTIEEADSQKWLNTVIAEHPDAREVYNSPELSSWIEKQPSFVRDAYLGILQNSTPEQTIELISAFKSATNVQDAKPEDFTDKAKSIIADTKKVAPTSLSDVPAGSPVVDESESVLEMSSAQLEAKFANKSPEQIRAMMSKFV